MGFPREEGQDVRAEVPGVASGSARWMHGRPWAEMTQRYDGSCVGSARPRRLRCARGRLNNVQHGSKIWAGADVQGE